MRSNWSHLYYQWCQHDVCKKLRGYSTWVWVGPSLVPRPHSLGQCSTQNILRTTCSKKYRCSKTSNKNFVGREMLCNNYWSHNLIGLYCFWVISRGNLTLFTRPFVAGDKCGWAGSKARLDQCASVNWVAVHCHMQTWIVGVWVTWWSWEWQNPFRWSARFSSRLVRLLRWSWEWMTSSRLHPGEEGRGEKRWEAKEFQWRRGERGEGRCVGGSEELEHSRHEPHQWSHAWEWRAFYFSLHTGKGHLIMATDQQLQCIHRNSNHISMYIDLCLPHCLLYEKWS